MHRAQNCDHPHAGVLEARLAMLVGGEVGRLLGQCGLAEVLERLAMYGQQHALLREQAQVRDHALLRELVPVD